MMLRMSASVVVVLLGSFLGPVSAVGSSPSCKAVKYYGVSGCELLPDQTCPSGYHKEAVGPPDPRMKAPTHLMCVADKPQPKEKEQPPSPPPPPKSNR
jgi:hypothetical protein